MKSSFNQSAPKIVGSIVISGIVLIGLYTLLTRDNRPAESVALSSNNSGYTITETDYSTATSTSTSTTTNASTSYQDGTYTSSTDYNVPHGSNTITVTVTVKNGLVSSVTTDHNYSDNESGSFINRFDAQLNNAVVGQAVDSATVSRLGGASLTSQAFNQALRQIEQQAAA